MKFIISVEETQFDHFIIEADNEEEAYETVGRLYDNGYVIVDPFMMSTNREIIILTDDCKTTEGITSYEEFAESIPISHTFEKVHWQELLKKSDEIPF